MRQSSVQSHPVCASVLGSGGKRSLIARRDGPCLWEGGAKRGAFAPTGTPVWADPGAYWGVSGSWWQASTLPNLGTSDQQVPRGLFA